MEKNSQSTSAGSEATLREASNRPFSNGANNTRNYKQTSVFLCFIHFGCTIVGKLSQCYVGLGRNFAVVAYGHR